MNRCFFSRTALSVLILFSAIITRAADANEQDQIAILQSTASTRDKDAACMQLKRIGTEQSVPALAALLTDEQLSRSARYALESMQSSAAGEALLAALPKTSGLLKVGIINSLAVRKDEAAVEAISGLLADANEQIAVAASEALGKIGGAKSLAALESAPASSANAVNDARLDARLMIANQMLTQGDDAGARKAFQGIYDGQKNESLRDAAFRGLILSSGQDGIQLMTDAISSDDLARQGAALQVASTLKSDAVTRALADLLPKTQAAVQIALLRFLAQRGDASVLQSVATLADSSDASVRLAAITALGDLGDGTVALLLARKAAGSIGADRAAARQSLLDLRHGSVTHTLVGAVADADSKVRLELLRAIGNRGDMSAVPDLIGFARNDDDSIRAASCQALASLAGVAQIPNLIQLVVDAKSDDARNEAAEALGVVSQRAQATAGHAAASALAAAIQNSPVEARVTLLPICAGLNEPAARDAVRAAMKDSEPRVRDAAIRAACDTHDPEMLPDLIQLAREGDGNKFRPQAIGGCVRLMTQEEKANFSTDEKIRVFKQIADSHLDAAEERMILSGLAGIADERAMALALPLVDDAAVRPEAARAVTQIAGAICGSNQEEASAALKKVLAAAPDEDAQKAANAILQRIHEMSTYITAWQVSGPYVEAGKNYSALFDIAFPPETGADNSVKWQTLPVGTDPAIPGKLDLLKFLGGEQRVAYVRTWIYSPDERKALLELGSDDGNKVWLNGELIHANNASRGFQAGSDKVDVTLKKGWNPLLLKITQNTLGWEFSVRFVGMDGAALSDIRASLNPS
ncbi:MAG TPA: HEAT repeat domain-containing protein [Verrucomicrobiae bacterium]|jgi:HEAT repeat protein